MQDTKKGNIIIINGCIQHAGIKTISRLVPVTVTFYSGLNKYLLLEYLFIHGCHSQRCLKFPDFFLTNVKFPWPNELTISHIRPDDGVNHPLHLFIYPFSKSRAVYIRVLGSIWKYRIQRSSWQICTIHATRANV